MSICASTCFIVSSDTDTTIKSEVPPKLNCVLVTAPKMFGKIAMPAKKIAPTIVILLSDLL